MRLEDYDAIVVHTCNRFRYRHDPLKAELNRIGILDKVKFQFNDKSLHDNVRSSLQRFLDDGWRNALFLEDDIRFLKDVCRVREVFDSSSDEHDICSFDNFIHLPKENLDIIRKMDKWIVYNPRVYGMSCWAVNNRRAAEILVRSYDQHPTMPPDKPCFTCHAKLKNAFHSRGVCIQLCYSDSSNVKHGWQSVHHGGYWGLNYRDYNVPDDYAFGSIVKPIVTMVDSMRRDELIRLVKSTGLDSVRMVEVGSYAGESADVFASIPEVKEIWCVDPWLNGYDDSDIASSSDMEKAERLFDEVAKRHSGKIRKFKGTLKEFVDTTEGLFDLVYIDANHTYESVRNDIILSMLLKPKFIAGHDYIHQYKGVIEAVNEFLGKPITLFNDGSWMKEIK